MGVLSHRPRVRVESLRQPGDHHRGVDPAAGPRALSAALRRQRHRGCGVARVAGHSAALRRGDLGARCRGQTARRGGIDRARCRVHGRHAQLRLRDSLSRLRVRASRLEAWIMDAERSVGRAARALAGASHVGVRHRRIHGGTHDGANQAHSLREPWQNGRGGDWRSRGVHDSVMDLRGLRAAPGGASRFSRRAVGGTRIRCARERRRADR